MKLHQISILPTQVKSKTTPQDNARQTTRHGIKANAQDKTKTAAKDNTKATADITITATVIDTPAAAKAAAP